MDVSPRGELAGTDHHELQSQVHIFAIIPRGATLTNAEATAGGASRRQLVDSGVPGPDPQPVGRDLAIGQVAHGQSSGSKRLRQQIDEVASSSTTTTSTRSVPWSAAPSDEAARTVARTAFAR